jgi:hypothetical protein
MLRPPPSDEYAAAGAPDEFEPLRRTASALPPDSGTFFCLLPPPPFRHSSSESALQCLVSATMQQLVDAASQQASLEQGGDARCAQGELDLMRWLTDEEEEEAADDTGTEDAKPDEEEEEEEMKEAKQTEEGEAADDPPVLLRRIAGAIERIEVELKDSRRTTHFLVSENTLLRSRQMERERLSHELRLQRQYGLHASIDGVAQQVAHLARQQNAMVDALREFNLGFDVVTAHAPVPAAEPKK